MTQTDGNVRSVDVQNNIKKVTVLDAVQGWKARKAMDDLISRKSAIRKLKREMSDHNPDYNVPIKHCIDAINSLPPVTPKQRTGHWVKVSYNMYGPIFRCSVCNHSLNLMERSTEQNGCDYDYCPWCGARMENRE